MKIIHKTKEAIKRYRLFKHGDKVLIGVSGGPDSVCLLFLLNHIKHELGIRLHAVHVNHKLRKSADADEKFVKGLASSLNIPCTTISLSNLKKTKGRSSLEEMAREERLRSLIQTAKKIKADTIALAHHQNDLAETVLMRIIRGSGLLGLQGIVPKRNIDGLSVIRPLLAVKREDILSFLKAKKIPYRMDPTNRQTKFFRNKIRLELMPLLRKSYNKNIEEILTQLADTSLQDYDYIESQAKKYFKKCVSPSRSKTCLRLSLAKFSKRHLSLQRLIIRLALSQLKGNTKGIAAVHLREIDDLIANRPNQSIVHLPYKIAVQKNRNYIIFRQLRKA